MVFFYDWGRDGLLVIFWWMYIFIFLENIVSIKNRIGTGFLCKISFSCVKIDRSRYID